MQTVDIYTGTSIRGPGRGQGRAMYLMRCYRPDGSVRKESKRIAAFADATESSLTLYALRDALSRFNCGCEIVLHTECGYVAAAINRGWPENGETAAGGTNGANR